MKSPGRIQTKVHALQHRLGRSGGNMFQIKNGTDDNVARLDRIFGPANDNINPFHRRRIRRFDNRNQLPIAHHHIALQAKNRLKQFIGVFNLDLAAVKLKQNFLFLAFGAKNAGIMHIVQTKLLAYQLNQCLQLHFLWYIYNRF